MNREEEENAREYYDIYYTICDKALSLISLTDDRQKRGKILRQRYRELEPLSGAWMIQSEFCRVQEVTAETLHRTPDRRIAN